MGILRDNMDFILFFEVEDESIGRDIVHQRNRHHGIGRCILCTLEVIGCLNPAGAPADVVGYFMISAQRALGPDWASADKPRGRG